MDFKLKNIKVMNDPDFILAPEHNNSLKEALDKKDTGYSDKKIAIFLGMDLQSFNAMRDSIIKKLSSILNK